MSKHLFHAKTELSSIVALLRLRASQKPERGGYTFLLDGEREEAHLDYQRLDQRARAIGAWLQSVAAPGERVLLLYPPGLDYICAFFGCLYAGVIAVPAYPPDPSRLNRTLPRLQALIKDSQATVALTTAPILSMTEFVFNLAPDLESLRWQATDKIDSEWQEKWRHPAVEKASLAFLQYTSGSTAAPRGVMLTHENLLHNSWLIQNCFGHTTESKGVIWLPPYHDMGLIGGILQPLYVGFPVVLLSPLDFLKKPLRWLQAVSRHGATTSGGPNFAYDLCVRKVTAAQRETLDLSTWQVAFNGAEPIRAETQHRFAQTFAACGFREEAFYPCYGLAEATLIASGGGWQDAPLVKTFKAAALAHDRVVETAANENGRSLVGCGQALPQQQILIVDPETSEKCAGDEIGEIWLAGPSVAAGYWDHPQKTAATFAARLAGSGDGPFLRTGDLGFLYKGQLFVTGRLKDLIIIRGRNYYPQDIERTVEQSHPALRPGCAAAFSIEMDGREQLVVVQEVDTRTSAEMETIVALIRQNVAEAHEVQLHTVVLIEPRTIPKTSSGKIQRHACRDAFLQEALAVVERSEQTAVGEMEAPYNKEAPDAETLLALAAEGRQEQLEIYLQKQVAPLLQVSPGQVGRQHSLSRFGLDSLMAVELQHHLETTFDVFIPIATLLKGVTVSQLASAIVAQLSTPSSPERVASAPQETAVGHPLSYGQQALWFLYQLAPDSAAYNVANAVRIPERLHVPALQRAFRHLVARHPSLRTTFTASPTGPLQRVHRQMDPSFAFIDASQWSAPALQEFLAKEAQRPFDLEKGPLVRVSVLQRAPQEFVLLLVMHHIIVDFWSLAVLARELIQFYQAERQGEAVALPSLALAYTGYARRQADMLAGEKGQQLRAYWQTQLAGDPPALELPTDYPRPPVQTYQGAVHTFELDAGLAKPLKEVGKRHGATLYMTLLAAFQVLLFRYTGQEDFLMGSLTAGRNRADLADVVGYFINPIVLRARPQPQQAFTAFLEQVRQTVLAAFTHDYPFNALVEQLRPVRDYSRSPLFQVMFVFQQARPHDELDLTPFALGVEGVQTSLNGLPLEPLALEQQVAQFDLTLTMGEVDGALVASFEYNTDLFTPERIGRLAAHFRTLLEGIAARPQQHLSALPLLTEAERRQLLVTWNGENTPQRLQVLIHTLFAEQVAQTPDAIAVIFADVQLTYRELNRRAEQVARYLQRAGVGPETIVGICMERSPEMVVAILGVLKTGGAYVPLDPAHPQERLAFVLQETQAVMLLSQAGIWEGVPDFALPVVYLDREWQQVTAGATVAKEGESQRRRETAETLACIIYTSGSTGRPKGILLTNGGIVNLIESFIRSYDPLPGDRILPLTSVASASFVGEILPLLCAGGTLVLPDGHSFLNTTHLFTQIEKHHVSILSSVPAVLAGLNGEKPPPPSLRLILSGGEALPAGHVDRLLDRVTVVNSYGLTETTVCSTYYKTSGDDFEAATTIPIGRPIINTGVYVLDSQLNALPVGCPGGLYISGEGLARGYLERAALTAERFIPNPYQPGKRMYRTGDLARWSTAGVLVFLGRLDHQVQIRGFRVEVSEIEAVLKQHTAVREAVVFPQEEPEGQKRLVMYVIPAQKNPPTMSTLRRFLQEKLPSYMIPADLVIIDSLPLLPNGTINFKALPAPAKERPALETAYIAPRSDVERTIVAIWQELLGVDKVGVSDNFFDLGGHSLLLAQAQNRLQAHFPQKITLVDLFKYPTVRSLAGYLSRQHREASQFQEVRNEAKRRAQATRRRRQQARQGIEAAQTALQNRQDQKKNK